MGFNDERKRMNEGELYRSNDAEILKEQLQCVEKLYDYNVTRPSEKQKRKGLLKEMFAVIGDGCHIEPPFHANWGGKYVHFGKGVYANFNLTLVDDVEIYVGDYTMMGPNVTIITGTHPILPELRKEAYQFNLPVYIGENVWIGAGTIVLPGITIGDNSVIGAGSIVTKDIPKNVVAYGQPCTIKREINDHDKIYYYKERKIKSV